MQLRDTNRYIYYRCLNPPFYKMIFTNNPDHAGSSLGFIQGIKILAKGRDDTLILIGILSEDILDNYYSFLDHVVHLDKSKLITLELWNVDIEINA